MKPLPTTYPELEIIDQLPLFIEYRVYNYQLRKDGSGKLRHGYNYSYRDIVSFICIYFIWHMFDSPWLTGFAVVFLSWRKTNQLLWESIRVFPQLGVQIESCTGFSVPFSESVWPWFTSRDFIPLDEMHDVLINEGLSRWDWYFYLTVVRRTPPKPFKGPDTPHELSMKIAFRRILPALDVIREVYHGIHELLSNDDEQRANVDDSTIARNVQEI